MANAVVIDCSGQNET